MRLRLLLRLRRRCLLRPRHRSIAAVVVDHHRRAIASPFLRVMRSRNCRVRSTCSVNAAWWSSTPFSNRLACERPAPKSPPGTDTQRQNEPRMDTHTEDGQKKMRHPSEWMRCNARAHHSAAISMVVDNDNGVVHFVVNVKVRKLRR